MQDFLSLFAERVARHPDRVAVVADGVETTYAELDKLSDQLAWQLQPLLQGRNDFFGLLSEVGLTRVVTTMAGWKANVCIVRLDYTMPDLALQDLIGHSGMIGTISDAPRVERAAAVSDLPNVLAPAQADQATPPFPPVAPGPTDAGMVGYTSGSTGRPKGVPSLRRENENKWRLILDKLGWSDGARIAIHNTFWLSDINAAIAAGATLECFDFRRDGPQAMAAWMRERNITHCSLFTAMLRQVMDAADAPLPGIKCIMTIGEPLRRADIDRFEQLCSPGSTLFSRLGSSEYGWISGYAHRHGAPVDFDTVPLGHPFNEDELLLLKEDGSPAAPGEPGEIVIESDCLPLGYHNDPERSADVFRAVAGKPGVRRYYSGDFAMKDHRGILHSMGRRDEQVKIRGYTVRPTDIEQMLLQHPALAAVAVVPFEGAKGIRRLGCHYVVKPDGSATPEELKAHLARQSPNYLIPTAYQEHAALPVNRNGKVQRSALGAPEAAGGAFDADIATGTERTLAAVWRDVLGHGEFGAQDDFFDVGGDSLQAMSMLVQIEHRFGRRLPLETLIIDGATIANLARKIDEAGSARTGMAVLKQAAGADPLFAVHVMGGHLSDYLQLAQALPASQPLYGLHPRGLAAEEAADTTVEAMAQHCLETIRTAGIRAPLRLIGYSFGGLIAYELARQAAEAGIPVSHLILLDPGIARSRAGKLVRAVYRPLRDGNHGLAWQRLRQTVPAAAGIASPEGGQMPLDEAHQAAFLRYQASPAALSNVLLVSAAGNPRRQENEAAWKALIGSGLTIAESPGDHSHMVRAPHHWTLAQRISEWLDCGQAQPSAAAAGEAFARPAQ